MKRFSDYRPSPELIEAIAARKAAGEKAARVHKNARQPGARAEGEAEPEGGGQDGIGGRRGSREK